MKYLLIALLSLLLADCAAHHHAQAKAAKSFQAAMKKVLAQRNDIRQIISRLPRTEAELAGPAQGNPNALLFNVQDFALRLPTIPLTGCPPDFKTAFNNYVAAWKERAALDPTVLLLTNPSVSQPALPAASGASQTEAAWQSVLAVQASYPVEASSKDH